jgi:3-deoxy-7-phosphoheptulonate synthase
MVIVFEPELADRQGALEAVTATAKRFPGVTVKPYDFAGADHTFTEVHLIGHTETVPTREFEELPGVLRVVRVSSRYRLIGRHDDADTVGFTYNGVRFDDKHLTLCAGLCAVDTKKHVDLMMRALAEHKLTTCRMGAFKPRTSPYDFQGLGAQCLPYVFELAGKHGIKVISMEVTDTKQITDVTRALADAGNPTGVMFQVGTRNAQNFELLKALGQQKIHPVLFKRGMGITLEESLNATEYVASEGNPNIVFCLRGVKTHLGDPHRNLVDFAHVPVVRRQTRMPVCIDPSHSVGSAKVAPDGIPDVWHIAAQGVISGATMLLVDFHPNPSKALCDGPQALTLDQLAPFITAMQKVRSTYEDLIA